MTNPSIEAQIRELLVAGNVEPAILQLAHYQGDDDEIFQFAYVACLKANMIFHFCQLYRTQERKMSRVPNEKILRYLTKSVVGMYMKDLSLELKDKQLTKDVMQAIFQMLVWQQMVGEFIQLYRSLNRLKRLPESLWPKPDTIYAAAQLCQQHGLTAERGQIRELFQC